MTQETPDQIKAQRDELLAEVERLRADGRVLRRMLGEQWCANQMIPFPYTDDGEFSDGSVHPCIDFMNEPADDIRRKMQTRLLHAIPVKARKTSRTLTQTPKEPKP
ncbi:MAG: hypothetical protein V4730_11985 [Pseudomonadota bacterium]